jgi:hypothetical protein
MRLYNIDSKIFEKLHIMEMGLKCSMFDKSPFLKIGETRACFQTVGKVEDLIMRLNIEKKRCYKYLSTIPKKETWNPVKPSSHGGFKRF